MKYLLKFITIIFLLGSSLGAEEVDETGSASIFSFFNGVALENNEVVLDGEYTYYTDEDGSVELILESGKHKVEIFAKDENGQNLGYTKKTIEVKNGRDTQLIATFKDGTSVPYVEVDTPLGESEVQSSKDNGIGYLSGTVLSSQTNKVIPNARIFVKGTSIDARTNEKGHFSVEIPANVATTISIVHSEYSSQTINDIKIETESSQQLSVKLTPASMELEEFVVLAPKIQGSIESIIAEEKESTSISNILSSEEMSKKGDSSAASALKRITGVTLVGGKNIYVRGLGERYSNIEMNSLPLPSPDPLKRSVPLDIFPSGAIGSMKVQKSATADVPSSFGGGYIDIRTKETQDDDYLKISLGGKANSNTGKTVNTYEGSAGDYLGFDNGYREINSAIVNNSQVVVGERVTALTTDSFTKEELSSMTQNYVNRNYDVTQQSQPFGFDFGIEGNKNIEIDDKHKISIFGNYKYETDSSSRNENYYKYNMQSSTGKLYATPSQYGTISQAITEYVHNAMLNIGYNYADLFDVTYTKLYTHNSEKVTKVADGIMGSNDEDMTKFYLNWEERTLDVDQLNAKFDYKLFGHESNVRIGLENAKAKLYQPNNYQYTYRNEGESFLDNKVSNNIANRLQTDDELFAFYIKHKLHFKLLSDEDYFDFGIAMSSKERSSKQNKFFLKKEGAGSIVDDSAMTGSIEGIYNEYVRADIDYDDRSLLVNQLFKPADYYDAEVDEASAYVNTFVKPMDNLEVLFGLRYVDFSQKVYQYEEDRQNPDMSKRRLITKTQTALSINTIYPSLGVKYKYDDDNIFDFALSQTYVAPDLREFTAGEYFHPYEVATIVGNPDLVNTDIYSLDLKYAHYFSAIDAIKLGTFYKYLDKPIEDVMVPSSSLPIYSFDNADYATLYGLEIDGRKGLGFIDERIQNYYISGNLSYTKSEVVLRSEQEAIYSTNHRELQGLSPLVINITLGYDVKGRSATFSYNKMGERIRKVGMYDAGTDSDFPDYKEAPAAILDFVWIESFKSGLSFKAKLGNILEEATIWSQGSRKTKEFKNPRTYSFSVAYKW